ncbi:MAG TPA: helix-turn-helix domain-containing protein [Dehalococcoidia bacterium]|jgi:AcrR family transcriptional regulator|nr:helix-turn-helix domain-containing protein [Dehalococcoidia bacterium]
MVTQRINPKTAPKRTRRGPFTRQQILDASLRLFSERGFARTTVRDIARQAGITDAAIYYHFESKRELLEALVEERGFLTSLQNLERVEAELSLREMVLWMAAGAINLMDENRDFLRLIIMEGLGGDEAALEQYTRLLDLWENALTIVLRRYEQKGELNSAPADELARQIIYLILMAFQDSLLGRHGFYGPSAAERQSAIRTFLGPSLLRLLVAPPAGK